MNVTFTGKLESRTILLLNVALFVLALAWTASMAIQLPLFSLLQGIGALRP